MNNFPRQNNFVLRLEDNAIDSLIHAVEHFLDGERITNLKYAILHVFHAVELFLKARLADINKELIFRRQNDKQKSDDTRYTISFNEAIIRL